MFHYIYIYRTSCHAFIRRHKVQKIGSKMLLLWQLLWNERVNSGIFSMVHQMWQKNKHFWHRIGKNKTYGRIILHFLVILIILLYQINSFCIFNTFENEVVLDLILSVKTRVNFKSINTLDRNIHKNVRFVPCQLFCMNSLRFLYMKNKFLSWLNG